MRTMQELPLKQESPSGIVRAGAKRAHQCAYSVGCISDIGILSIKYSCHCTLRSIGNFDSFGYSATVPDGFVISETQCKKIGEDLESEITSDI